ATGFNVDIKVFEFENRRIDECGNGQGVVHVWSNHKTLFAVVIDRISRNLCRGLADRVLTRLQDAHLLVCERSSSSNVEPDHRDRNSGLEDDASGLRVYIDVEF